MMPSCGTCGPIDARYLGKDLKNLGKIKKIKNKFIKYSNKLQKFRKIHQNSKQTNKV